MTDVRSAWSEAGDRLSTLGSSLKAHYERQRGTEGEKTREEVNEAVKRLKDAVQDAVDAVGAAAKDPGVKDDVKKVGQSLSDALGVTFAEVSEDLRKAFNQRKGQASTSQAQEEPMSPASPEGGRSGTVGPASSSSAPEQGSPSSPSQGSGSPDDDRDEPPRVEPWGTP